MWSFKSASKTIITVAASIILLAGCTFRPVYEQSDARKTSISYGAPASQIEQALIEEIKFRLGEDKAGRYKISFATSASTRTINSVSSQFVRTEYEATVRSTYTLIDTQSGDQIGKAERFASAIYQGSSQNVANAQAQKDAYERAARDVARQISLLVSTAIQGNEN